MFSNCESAASLTDQWYIQAFCNNHPVPAVVTFLHQLPAEVGRSGGRCGPRLWRPHLTHVHRVQYGRSLLFCKKKNNSLSNPYIGLVGLHWYILLLVIAVQMLSKQDLYFILENNCDFGVGRRRELTAAQQTGHNCRLHCNILCRAAQTEQWNGCNTWPGPLTYCLLLLRTNWVQWSVMGLLFIHCTIYSEPLSCIGPET